MIKWFKDIVDYFRIKIDFVKDDRLARKVYFAEAEITFDTAPLQVKVTELLKPIHEKGDKLFIQPMNKLSIEIEILSRKVAFEKTRLSYFQRDYKNELDQLYLKKDCLYSHLEEIQTSQMESKEQKQSLYNDVDDITCELNDVRKQLDAWYGKAERHWVFLGNSRKKLPQNAWFGQDISERDNLKEIRDALYSQRNSVFAEIDIAKSRLTELQREWKSTQEAIQQVKKNIANCKQDRQHRFKLKEDGHTQNSLTKRVSRLCTELSLPTANRATMKKRFENYLLEAKQNAGVFILENRINEMEENLRNHLLVFDTRDAKTKRRELHRANWSNRKKQM